MSEAFYCQTQDLAIGYGKTPLLQNIGIGVQRGQILALIGPNGAGKSTLLKRWPGSWRRKAALCCCRAKT